MEANIQHINVYDDGLIEMIVVCNSCKKLNVHTITHASTKSDDKITIDFFKLGKRCCGNHGKPGKPDTMCCANYNLYR